MGRNESTVELLVKLWEGIREFLEVPNESTGSFIRHMRVNKSKNFQYSTRVYLAPPVTHQMNLSKSPSTKW